MYQCKSIENTLKNAKIEEKLQQHSQGSNKCNPNGFAKRHKPVRSKHISPIGISLSNGRSKKHRLYYHRHSLRL